MIIQVSIAGNERTIDASAVAALAGQTALQRLSLFAGRIGDEGAACIVGHAKEHCWPNMQQLDVGACGLSLVIVQQLVIALSAGALPALQVCCAACWCRVILVRSANCRAGATLLAQELSIAANPATQDQDELEEVLLALGDRRHALDVSWRGM